MGDDLRADEQSAESEVKPLAAEHDYRLDAASRAKLLNGIARDADLAARSHYYLASFWRDIDNVISIPLTLATAVTGGGVVAGIGGASQGEMDHRVSWFRYLTLAFGALATVLAALQGHLHAGRKAEAHEATGKQYAFLRARARFHVEASASTQAGNAELLQRLMAEHKQIRAGAPPSSRRAYSVALKQLAEKQAREALQEARQADSTTAARPAVGYIAPPRKGSFFSRLSRFRKRRKVIALM